MPGIEVLAHSCAISVLLTVADSPGITRSGIAKADGGRLQRTRFLTVQELVGAGLLRYDEGEKTHSTVRYHLTPLGISVVGRLREINDMLGGEQ